jgi:hypothetical protein
MTPGPEAEVAASGPGRRDVAAHGGPAVRADPCRLRCRALQQPPTAPVPRVASARATRAVSGGRRRHRSTHAVVTYSALIHEDDVEAVT